MKPEHQAGQVEELSVIQRQMAKKLRKAMSEAVHVTIFAECDVSKLIEMRVGLKEKGAAPSLTHFLIAAVTRALILHPRFNAQFVNECLMHFDDVNIGFAISMPGGDLINPVLPAVQCLGAPEIAQLAQETVEKARKGKLGLADYQGAGFTLSSVGRTPTPKYATPIIPVPQVAILAAMAVRNMPVVRKSEIEIAAILPVSLSFDHRVINGVEANSFLESVAAALAKPQDLMTPAV